MPIAAELARSLARELWDRGYSVRYIAGRLGVSDNAARRFIGFERLVRRGTRRRGGRDGR